MSQKRAGEKCDLMVKTLPDNTLKISNFHMKWSEKKKIYVVLGYSRGKI